MSETGNSAGSPARGCATTKHLETALEGAGIATWDWDIATGLTQYNRHWARIIGYGLQEVDPSLEFWKSLVHPDDLARVLAAVNAHLSGLTAAYQIEYRLRHQSGRWVWVEAYGSVYEYGPDGKPARMGGIHNDITRRKDAEEALLLSRETYRHTVELTTQIPWTAGPDGNNFSCDPAFEVYTGLSMDTVRQLGWLEAFHPDDRPRAIAQWRRSIGTGEPYRIASRLWHRSGEYRYCESRALAHRNEAGEIVRWYGTTEDIHERTVAAQSLQASETRRSLALEGAQLATWDWNLRTQVVTRDSAWFAMLGYPEAGNQNSGFWFSLLHPDDGPEVERLWQAHCADDTLPFRAHYRIRHQTGTWRWMVSHGRIVERDEQGPVRACGVNQDVTGQRKAEEALIESEQFSRQLLESYQDFVAVLDGSGRMEYLNPAAQKRLSMTDDVREMSCIDIWPSEAGPRVEQGVKAAFAGKTDSFQIHCPENEALAGWWDVTFSPVARRADQPVRILIVARDITRLRAEEEKQRGTLERERLQTIVENLSEGVVIASPDGLVILMNKCAREMYGVEECIAGGLHCQELFGMVDAGPGDDRPLARAIRGESFSGVETVFHNRMTGREWIAQCGSTPLRAASGELLMGVLSVRDVTSERQAATEIRRANAGLHDLSGQLLRLQDDERRRIARELHDGTVQTLSAALMNLSMLGESSIVKEAAFECRLVQSTHTLVDQGAKELRTLSYLLHPPVLDELGLIPALRSWIDGFSGRTGLPVDISMPAGMKRLTPDIETALFRIVQEGLGNVHRHANAANAGVRIRVEHGTIYLEISDDGVGFHATDTSPSGVGLPGMRERATQLGGTRDVESAPGRTVIRVSLPLRYAHE